MTRNGDALCQISLDREVVVKLIRPDLVHFANTRERFRRDRRRVD